MMSARHARLVLASIALAATLGCHVDSARTVSATIGPAGGSLSADDGRIRLEVPSGALARNTELRIAPSTVELTGLLPDTTYDLSPDGLQFVLPVKITIHPDPSETLDALTTRIVRIHDGGIQFDDDPAVDIGAHTVSASLSGFSSHGAGSTLTLCPEGCPSVPTVTATAFPDNHGFIRLTGSCNANGGGTTSQLVIERAFVPRPDSVLADFVNWAELRTIDAPPTDIAGTCSYRFDDADVCPLWTYAYHVRARSLQTTTNASAVALALGPGDRTCAVGGPGPDAGVFDGGVTGPDGGTGGPGSLTLHTYRRRGLQAAIPENAAWVGGQDGRGGFAPLTGNGGVYMLPVTDVTGQYGIAVVCTTQSTPAIQVLQGSLVEGSDIHVVCGEGEPATVQVSVRSTSCVSAQLQVAGSTVNSPCGNSTNTPIEAGIHDALGISFANGTPDRTFVLRDFAGSTLVADFSGPTSAPAMVKQVLVSPGALWSLDVWTPAGLLITSGEGFGLYGGFPATLRGPRDIHVLCTVAGALCHFFREPVDIDDRNLSDPADPVVTVTTSSASWQPYLSSGFRIAIGPYTFWVSAGWLGGADSYTYPRLCSLPGFPAQCVDAVPPGNQYSFRAYKPVGGFVAALPDIANAENDPTRASDGLAFAQATTSGRL